LKSRGFLLFVTALLFFWRVTPLASQTDEAGIFRLPLGAETLPRFREICKALGEPPVIKGVFEQTKTLNRLNRSLVSRGNFIIARGFGMLWETLSPFPSTLAVGRDFLIQSIPGGAKTKLDAAGNETFLRLSEIISAVFSGDSQRLLDNFDNYFTETEGRWILGLVPRERAVRSFAARIVMSGDSVIRGMTLYEQNGDRIEYTLSRHVLAGALSANERAAFSL
jgi:hypothetical protein